jgi:HAD superfamily hydrolase (TIGR01509 family)
MLKALLFDFDGLILDTETPEFQIWQSIYREHGQELPAERWLQIVGGYGMSDFDAAQHLLQLTDGGVDPNSLRARHRMESDDLTLAQPVLPGVMDLLDQARSASLALAVVSSSPHSWVDLHLSRLKLLDHFSPVICADDVSPGKTKPNPDLYLKVLEVMGLPADEALAFEDSFNGVKAARAAGLFVVAVPNQVTSLLGVDGANLTLKSLTEFHLADFLRPR